MFKCSMFYIYIVLSFLFDIALHILCDFFFRIFRSILSIIQ